MANLAIRLVEYVPLHDCFATLVSGSASWIHNSGICIYLFTFCCVIGWNVRQKVRGICFEWAHPHSHNHSTHEMSFFAVPHCLYLLRFLHINHQINHKHDISNPLIRWFQGGFLPVVLSSNQECTGSYVKIGLKSAWRNLLCVQDCTKPRKLKNFAERSPIEASKHDRCYGP